jgi:iron(III) transport system ATP-binding protein
LTKPSHNSGPPLLRVDGISKRFGEVVALSRVSIEVEEGEIHAMIGPSGCGKSTLLRIVAGFETADEGAVHLGQCRIDRLKPEERGVGIVFQDYALFPHMTVAENVAFALKHAGEERRAAGIGPLMRMVRLVGLEARYPDELSGGQQQRVALARTFAGRPRAILLDEPFSNLDATLREATRREIRSILKASGLGILFVTHDREEALSFADRISVLRDGRLEQTGAPREVYFRPVNAFVAGFLGPTNLLDGMSDGAHAETAVGRLQLDRTAKGRVRLSLRPEAIAIMANGGDGVPAIVTERVFKGHDASTFLRVGETTVEALAPASSDITPGQHVRIFARAPAVVLEG